MKIQFKKILCATDLSDISDLSIGYGIALAREFNAKLFVCHLVDMTSTAIHGEAIHARINLQNEVMEHAIKQLNQMMEHQQADWEPLISTGRPADEIARMVEEKKIDLVISKTHGRTGLKRVVLGSVTGRLMHTLSCPLLIVRSLDDNIVSVENLETKFHRILVGCDFSPDSNNAFQYGLSLAQEFQSELHLTHVIEPSVYKKMLKPNSNHGQEIDQSLHAQIKSKFSEMIPEESLNWVTPKIILLSGQPFEEITKYSMLNNIDLIVLGIRGHNLIDTLFAGSTTDRVARQAPCPVLSVWPVVQKG
jgi:nucleotide-binding universal stress UspA family protein